VLYWVSKVCQSRVWGSQGPYYYNLKLSLGYKLSKDLRRYKGFSQLVKHKDTGIYLHYIYQSYMRQLFTIHESMSYIAIRKEQ